MKIKKPLSPQQAKILTAVVYENLTDTQLKKIETIIKDRYDFYEVKKKKPTPYETTD